MGRKDGRPETFTLRDGRLVQTGGTNPATDRPTPQFQQLPLQRQRGREQPDGFPSSDPHPRLNSPIEQAIYEALTKYRDYFSQRCREASARDITDKVNSLGELSNAESIMAVVQRSIDWSGHTVPQQEIPTITNAVTTAIQSALKQ